MPALGGCLVPGGACSGGSAPGGVPGLGWSAPREACSGGCLVLGGGGCLLQGVPGGDPPRTATAASGTHPTGMHSCWYLNLEMKISHDSY